ncbi:hypothetical protein DFS34DRAFT_607342 [Phlyctochytrium arcticum]|nr:hypothetical protein DFS34DRAFT_607342 [Phlyctochytrium arcticum]
MSSHNWIKTAPNPTLQSRRGGRFTSTKSNIKSISSGGKRYDPGCVMCGTKSSPRFHERSRESLFVILDNGIDALWNKAKAGQPFKVIFCNACLLKCKRLLPGHHFEPSWTLASAEEEPPLLMGFVADLPEDSADMPVITFLHDRPIPDDASPVQGLGTFKASVQLLQQRPFLKASPFAADLLEFIEHLETKCDKMLTKKAVFLGDGPDWNTKLSLRLKRGLVFSVIYDAALYDHTGKINYIKDTFMAPMLGASNSAKRFLSAFNLCYSPTMLRQKMNATIVDNLDNIKKALALGNMVPVLKMDDFNRVHVQGTPGSANAGRFSSLHTQAHLAIKMHTLRPTEETDRFAMHPLPVKADRVNFHELYANMDLMEAWVVNGLEWASDAADGIRLRSTANSLHVTFNVDRDLTSLPAHLPAEPYFLVWERRVASKAAYTKTMYKFSMATHAGELNSFHVFQACPNAMKSTKDMKQLLDDTCEFTKDYDKAMWLVGDFYVFRNIMKLLWSLDATEAPKEPRPKEPTLQERLAYLGRKQSTVISNDTRQRIILWPDMMHIALNAQLALLAWAFGVVMPLWNAAFPDAALNLVKLRPIRRVMILTMMLLAWKHVRDEVIKAYYLKKATWTTTQRIFVESLIRLFDEDIPLVLDAAAAMADRNVSLTKAVLLRLLPLFIRCDKKNYVVVILFLLGSIRAYQKGDDAGAAGLESFLPVASSEDLEVFHSLLRAVSRPHDPDSILVLKALYISASQNKSASAFLSQLAELRKQEEERKRPEAAFMSKMELGSATPTQTQSFYMKRSEDVSNALLAMFMNLMGPPDSIVIAGSYDAEHSATTRKKSPIYKVMLICPPEPARPATSKPANKQATRKKASGKENKTTKFMKPVLGTLFSMSEKLLPFSVWKSPHVRLNTEIDITNFKVVNFPLRKAASRKRKALADKNAAPQPAQDVFLDMHTTLLDKMAECSCLPTNQQPCHHFLRHIAKNTMSWYFSNLTAPLDMADLLEEDEDGDVNFAELLAE